MKKNKIYKYIVIGVLIVSFFSLFLYKTPYVAAFNAKSLGHPSCNLPKGNLVVPIKLTYKDKAMLLNQLYTNALFTKAVREIEKENGKVDLLYSYIRAVDINGTKIEEV